MLIAQLVRKIDAKMRDLEADQAKIEDKLTEIYNLLQNDTTQTNTHVLLTVKEPMVASQREVIRDRTQMQWGDYLKMVIYLRDEVLKPRYRDIQDEMSVIYEQYEILDRGNKEEIEGLATLYGIGCEWE